MPLLKNVRTALWFVAVPVLAGLSASVLTHEPVTRARTPIHIPDLPGHVTLKCDFHIHTVFSDGLVWPSVRAEEAWREGLDAIAITDHLEYQSHKADLSTNHNRSFDIARSAGADLDLLVIKGPEITRKMPPGYLNAIFLTNSTSLAVTNWRDATAAAHQQGAFIFWNHPGWEAQITNGLTLAAQKTVLLAVAGKTATEKGRKKLNLPYTVTNFLIGPDEPLPVTIDLVVSFTPASTK